MATDTAQTDYYLGTGRRKTAVARVRVCEGDGQFLINNRPLENYFPLDRERNMVRAPLETAELVGRVNCRVNVRGGGVNGQAGAVTLGIGRALKAMRPDLEQALRDNGFLTRDSRKVERKKYGRKGARKSFQFSKR
jgi:small subunit ribosomal protein S9